MNHKHEKAIEPFPHDMTADLQRAIEEKLFKLSHKRKIIFMTFLMEC